MRKKLKLKNTLIHFLFGSIILVFSIHFTTTIKLKEMNKKNNVTYSFILFLFCLSISSQDYDLLIQNGHVIDVKNKIDDFYDIAISKNKIVSVEKKINAKNAKRVIDASGLIVVPGLIDIHSHNFHGTILIGI